MAGSACSNNSQVNAQAKAPPPTVQVAVDETLRRYNPKKSSSEDLRETVRRAARRAAQETWGKKPVTRVTVVEL